ncbi:MAG: HAMP domain-containing histidine kinase [Nevskia sp.]|jgi:signal transduction histidine kinase|nr:HAMP domain-containing histidine kinase [Nevskia sp.]MCK9384904.1 HAMP domain-containing histidine kinase [Nevskia sp.]
MSESSPLHARLLYQIALRLLAVALLFALLEVVIVFAMYARDEETLSGGMMALETTRITHLLEKRGTALPAGTLFDASPLRAAAVFSAEGALLLSDNPGQLPLPAAPLAERHLETAREMIGRHFLVSGTRRIVVNGRPLWLALAISGQGLRPFLPALYQEVIEHALQPLIPLSLLLLVFNVAIVRRMLTPLERAVADVDALAPAEWGRRLQVPASPVEVRSLLHAVNRALDRLERAMHTLRQFTADAAHELRTPLAVMTLSIDSLPPSPERQKLRQDAAAMTRLIGQMLDLARADAHEEPRGATSNLSEFAHQVATELAPLAIGAGKRIDYRDHGGGLVLGHSELLARALRNVIENALAHTPADSAVEIVVGPGAQIAVRDHGPGIPAAARDRVFQRFWRGDRRHAGAGLGLAITRSIMDACGGRIEIDDADGGGARVTLVFQDSQAAAQAPTLPLSPAHAAIPLNTPHGAAK